MTKKVLTDKEAFDIIVKHVEKRAYGEVSEWFMVPVLKTGVVSPTVGSNPTFSAVEKLHILRRHTNTTAWRSTQVAEGAPLERE